MDNTKLQLKINELHSSTPENVHGVGYGYKIVDGQKTDQLSIIFIVDQKIPAADVPDGELIPSLINIDGENIPTDVISLGRMKAISACFQAGDSTSDTHRQRKSSAIGGISIGTTTINSAGTLGGVVIDSEDGSFVGITNTHVAIMNDFNLAINNSEKVLSDFPLSPMIPVWKAEDNKICQPGIFDNGTNPPANKPEEKIGSVKRYYPLSKATYNTVDAALIGLDPGYVTSISDAKKLLDISNSQFPFASTNEINNLLSNQIALYRSGRTTGSNNADSSCKLIITGLNIATSVDFDGTVLGFSNVMSMEYQNTVSLTHPTTNVVYTVPQGNASAPGDSGSMVLASIMVNGVPTVKIIGLVFAGGPYKYGPPVNGEPWAPINNNFALLIRIDEIVSKLNIQPLTASTITTNPSNNWAHMTKQGLLQNITLIENGNKYWQAGTRNRDGSSNPDSVYVKYSNDSNNTANLNYCAVWNNTTGIPTTVGSNGRASAYDTYDQTGNVFEWCVRNTNNKAQGRGGAYHWSPDSSDAAFVTEPVSQGPALGFRIATSANRTTQPVDNPLNLPNFKKIEDLNNTADSLIMIDGTSGYGSVNYAYHINAYLVTNCEYAEFLNSVAKTDTYSLYHPDMGNNNRGGINRSGVSGSYAYTVKPNMGNKPINYVTSADCARYCNWLHNGKKEGNQDNSTTEDGAYSLFGATSANTLVKNTNANYWIPTENEWYKAAYYKGAGTNSGYWRYATQSNDWPSCVSANSSGDGPVLSNYICPSSQATTPTPTPTVTPTVTNTRTPTPTPTITNTGSPTPTVTNTRTPTPTITISPTPSQTVGISSTPTPTNTITPSLTQTVTPTKSPTPTATRTSTPTPTVTKTPTVTPTSSPESANMCGLHLSGALIGGSCIMGWVTEAEKLNTCHNIKTCNYVIPGEYASLTNLFNDAKNTTLDGLLIPAGFRLIVWTLPNFQGEILIDQVGPAIVNNIIWSDSAELEQSWAEAGSDLIQKYPTNTRMFSISDMRNWINGSFKVFCDRNRPQCPEIPLIKNCCDSINITTINVSSICIGTGASLSEGGTGGGIGSGGLLGTASIVQEPEPIVLSLQNNISTDSIIEFYAIYETTNNNLNIDWEYIDISTIPSESTNIWRSVSQSSYGQFEIISQSLADVGEPNKYHNMLRVSFGNMPIFLRFSIESGNNKVYSNIISTINTSDVQLNNIIAQNINIILSITDEFGFVTYRPNLSDLIDSFIYNNKEIYNMRNIL